MALDLKRLKEVNDRFKPFRQSLDDLEELIEAAVESQQLVEKTQRQVDAQSSELSRMQRETDMLKEDMEKSNALYIKQRNEHKASIQALVDEKQRLLAQMDTELKEHKARIQQEMEHTSMLHQQKMVDFSAEQAKAKKLLDAAQKSLAEMTDRVRQTLGL